MDRVWTGETRAEATSAVLPSRRPALERLRAALPDGAGPLLLTGEAGSGKTWLATRLASEDRAEGSSRWLAIDLAPTTTPDGLLHALAARLGLDVPPGIHADALRLLLADHLAELSADGRRRALVVDEAHLGSVEVLEEVRLLSNRLGRSDGFAAIVLVGQTPLLRRLATRPLAALDARIAARAHLGPIDADEARVLLAGRAGTLVEVERRHRDAAGNPGRLLRFDRPRPATPPSPRPRRVEVEADPGPITPLVPARPPIRVEDGLIEVGWEGEGEPRPDRPTASEPVPEEPVAPTPPSPKLGVEEVVDDPYAALQAWAEWAAHPGRRPTDLEGPDADDDPIDSTLRDLPNLRAEGSQEFAPYSQLFSRLRQAKQED